MLHVLCGVHADRAGEFGGMTAAYLPLQVAGPLGLDLLSRIITAQSLAELEQAGQQACAVFSIAYGEAGAQGEAPVSPKGFSDLHLLNCRYRSKEAV